MEALLNHLVVAFAIGVVVLLIAVSVALAWRKDKWAVMNYRRLPRG